LGRTIGVDAVGTAGEDDALGVHALDIFPGGVVVQQLAVDAALTDAARDELAVLRAEIEHDHGIGRRHPMFGFVRVGGR
jgi:hypothetical protein